MESKQINHLFRHHSGKMVAVLTRIFGLKHLDIIEDAVQDTFLKATLTWRNQQPENPEAWLTQAAKNRVLDLFRKLKASQKLLPELKSGIDTISINNLFLDNEIEDAQLRMIFTACHPKLTAKDRIAFALKTISGFSSKEISSALLTKEETIKKRLSRARKTILKTNLKFAIPQGKNLTTRLESVLEILYLIFNEGFHSNKKETLVRKELCGEAMRLCKFLLKNKYTQTSESYALFALMCFHAARLTSKTTDNEVFDLKNQDRTLWHFPLIQLGNIMMTKAIKENIFSCYHYEAAIAAEHLKVTHFEDTNWKKVLFWYERLYELQPMPSHLLTMAVVSLQQKNYIKANQYFKDLKPDDFAQRSYLYYSAKSDYFCQTKKINEAIVYINLALDNVTNTLEKEFLEKKKQALLKY